MLKSNPFRNYTSPIDLGPLAPEPTPCVQPAKPSSRAPKTIPTPPPTADRRERVAVRLNDVYPADEPGVEYSIDELRARRRSVREPPSRPEWMVEALKSRGESLVAFTATAEFAHRGLLGGCERWCASPRN
jgi:hypothetical protein